MGGMESLVDCRISAGKKVKEACDIPVLYDMCIQDHVLSDTCKWTGYVPTNLLNVCFRAVTCYLKQDKGTTSEMKKCKWWGSKIYIF